MEMDEKPIRILHVLGKLNRGGAETLVMNLYRKIDRRKFQFDFIVHLDNYEEGEYEKEILKLGGRIYSIPRYKFFNHFQYKRAWNQFFNNHKEYKIIHGHVRSTAAIYLKIAKKYGLKTISHSHSISSGRGIKAIIKNILQYNIRYVADYFMGCSKKANEWLFGKKVANSEKCMVLENGIEISNFLFNSDIRKEIREKLLVKEDEILIGHVGRFSPEKNHKFIMKVFKRLYDINSKYKLLLIGNGIEKKKVIKKYCNKKFMTNVICLNTVPDVYNYMQAMDLFILPSKYEGLGMVLIEAQFAGLKCIASKNVPTEVKITNNIKFEKLKISIWLKEITNIDISRNSDIINNKSKQYDINKTAKKLQDFYLKIGEYDEV